MLRTLIIDDEAHIRNTLSLMLVKYCPQVEISGEADGVSSGIDAIRTLHPDLVFLDIHLADGTAFDLLDALDNISFKLIFISAFNKEMIQAFRLSSIEFLVKPVNPIALVKAVQNAEFLTQEELLMQLKALETNVNQLNR